MVSHWPLDTSRLAYIDDDCHLGLLRVLTPVRERDTSIVGFPDSN